MGIKFVFSSTLNILVSQRV